MPNSNYNDLLNKMKELFTANPAISQWIKDGCPIPKAQGKPGAEFDKSLRESQIIGLAADIFKTLNDTAPEAWTGHEDNDMTLNIQKLESLRKDFMADQEEDQYASCNKAGTQTHLADQILGIGANLNLVLGQLHRADFLTKVKQAYRVMGTQKDINDSTLEQTYKSIRSQGNLAELLDTFKSYEEFQNGKAQAQNNIDEAKKQLAEAENQKTAHNKQVRAEIEQLDKAYKKEANHQESLKRNGSALETQRMYLIMGYNDSSLALEDEAIALNKKEQYINKSIAELDQTVEKNERDFVKQNLSKDNVELLRQKEKKFSDSLQNQLKECADQRDALKEKKKKAEKKYGDQLKKVDEQKAANSEELKKSEDRLNQITMTRHKKVEEIVSAIDNTGLANKIKTNEKILEDCRKLEEKMQNAVTTNKALMENMQQMKNLLADKKLVRLNPEKKLTANELVADPRDSIMPALRNIAGRLNSEMKADHAIASEKKGEVAFNDDYWKKFKDDLKKTDGHENSKEFVEMMHQWKRMESMDGSRLNNDAVKRMLTDLREATAAYIGLKEKQWYILFPSKRRTQRLSAAKNMLSLVDNVLDEISMDPSATKLENMTEVLNKCRDAKLPTAEEMNGKAMENIFNGLQKNRQKVRENSLDNVRDMNL